MDNIPGLSIRDMNQDDLAFAAECTAAEGWASEDLVALEGFYLKDSKGCLLAEQNGYPIGICVATSFGTCGFIGELIVRPEARGKGIGAALLNQAVLLLQDQGAETIYLDGVLRAVTLYERNGFRKLCRSWRFSGNLVGQSSLRVQRMNVNDLDQVVALDQRYFGADRSFFLKRRMELFPEFSHVLWDGGRLSGYILGRSGNGWVVTGPWVVEDTVEHAAELLKSLALEADAKTIMIGILDTNQFACELVRSLGFTARTDSPWRMAMGSSSNLGASPQCYAVGSGAKG